MQVQNASTLRSECRVETTRVFLFAQIAFSRKLFLQICFFIWHSWKFTIFGLRKFSQRCQSLLFYRKHIVWPKHYFSNQHSCFTSWWLLCLWKTQHFYIFTRIFTYFRKPFRKKCKRECWITLQCARGNTGNAAKYFSSYISGLFSKFLRGRSSPASPWNPVVSLSPDPQWRTGSGTWDCPAGSPGRAAGSSPALPARAVGSSPALPAHAAWSSPEQANSYLFKQFDEQMLTTQFLKLFQKCGILQNIVATLISLANSFRKVHLLANANSHDDLRDDLVVFCFKKNNLPRYNN